MAGVCCLKRFGTPDHTDDAAVTLPPIRTTSDSSSRTGIHILSNRSECRSFFTRTSELPIARVATYPAPATINAKTIANPGEITKAGTNKIMPMTTAIFLSVVLLMYPVP